MSLRPPFCRPDLSGPILFLAMLFAVGTAVDAQTKGRLSYNGDKDAAFLILNGRNDNRAARLSVDGGDNLRGFMELHNDGLRRFYAYVDGDGEGGLTLSSPTGEAVNLFIDNSSNSGVLHLRDGAGESRVRLFVDDQGQGQLRLEGETNSDRVSLYVDGEDQGGLSIFDDSGDLVGNLYVDDDSDTGVLVLKNSSGETRAFLRVTDSGRGKLSLDGSDNVEKVDLYVDGVNQGGLAIRGTGGADAGSMFVGDSTNAGVLRLMRDGGGTRAEMSVDSAGRGQLILDGAGGGQRARLNADSNNNGLLALRSSAGERAAMGIDNSSGGGALVLRDASGNITVTLDGATGVLAKSGVNGFLIDHPNNTSQQIFYASVEGPEAGMYIRGSGRLSDGVAEIALPGHFEAVARRETVTVQVTPTSRETRGLIVTKKSTSSFVVEELGEQFGKTTFDWLVMAERGDIDPIQVVRGKFALQLQQLQPARIELDRTTMPIGLLPIIEPKADRPVVLNLQRFEAIRRGEPVNAEILLKPDVAEGILVNPGRIRDPDLLNPGRIKPGLTAPLRPNPMRPRQPLQPLNDQ